MLAIVIPYYKQFFFRETLNALSNQTNKNFTVYVGNDASPQNPKEVMAEFQGNLNIVYKEFKDNLGATSLTIQWHRCLDLTKKEEWVLILGDDDVLGENLVEEFYKHIKDIEENNIDVVRFASQKINEKSLPFSKVYQHKKLEKTTDFIFKKTRSSLSEYVFKKNKLSEIGFRDFPLGWYSDKMAVIEISDFKYIYTINSAVAKIRISNESISGSILYEKEKEQASFLYYYMLIRNFKANFSFDEIKQIALFLNKRYLNDKREIKRYFKITLMYLSQGMFSEVAKFQISIFRNLMKF